jgi:hypothetical protein
MVVRASWAAADDASAATNIAARIVVFLIVPSPRARILSRARHALGCGYEPGAVDEG